MQSFMTVTSRFAAFKRVKRSVLIGTVGASLVGGIGMMLLGEPLYLVALFALLPWVPVMSFEGLWKVEHYGWIAVFAMFLVLQVGHLGEHVMQVSQLSFLSGTMACPPPIDTEANAARAVSAGLRSAGSPATGFSSSSVVMPTNTGTPMTDANGSPISGPAACGIFGQLDIEIVHVVWELLGWVMTAILLVRFPRNGWLWFAMFWLIIHTIEHLFISYTFFFDHETVYTGTRQLWATVADGHLVTAYPAGTEPALLRFYDVAGKFGIGAKNGLLGTFIPTLNSVLPTRPYLHFYYNTLVTVPTVIAFLVVVRKAYDRFLAQALPVLTTDELARITAQLEVVRFRAGETIIQQGTIADHFYVISKGRVEVFHEENGKETRVNRLKAGQYFGEIALRQGGVRTATVRAVEDVELLKLDAHEFDDLMTRSDLSRKQIDWCIDIRAEQVIHATQGAPT